MILLDTNVVSAAMHLEQEVKVRDWIIRQTLSDLFVPTPVVFEIIFGIAKLPAGRRRTDLERRFEDFLQSIIANRIVQFDVGSAKAAGHIHVITAQRSRAKQIVDSQIAGMGRALGAAIATRNTKDFAGLGLQLVNPWK